MTNVEFELALEAFPCPDCGEAGHLTTTHMIIKADYKGQTVEVAGKGWTCRGGCDAKFMSDAMTEEFANKVSRIDDGIAGKYYQVNRKTGELQRYTLQ